VLTDADEARIGAVTPGGIAVSGVVVDVFTDSAETDVTSTGSSDMEARSVKSGSAITVAGSGSGSDTFADSVSGLVVTAAVLETGAATVDKAGVGTGSESGAGEGVVVCFASVPSSDV